ncbi:MAG: hypothetical protein K6B14_06030 [Lachnospiraceae bacterium]|nr:hypothetical protein [Lachnospiraceae bacterium]
MFSMTRIAEGSIREYEDIIPRNYHGEINTGELLAMAIYEEDDSLYGIMVTDVVDDWLYLVWFYLADPDIKMVEKASFVRYCITQAKGIYDQHLVGAFMEVYPDEEEMRDIKDVMFLVGMNVREAKSNIFEFSLSQVEGVDALKKAATKMECKSLSDMESGDLNVIENMMQEDVRPIPVPMIMDWDSYLPDISVFGIKRKVPCGALLFSMREETLVAELAYAADPVALPAMLGAAYEKAMEIYGGDQRVTVPVVVNKTENLVEKIVPKADRADVLEGVLLF